MKITNKIISLLLAAVLSFGAFCTAGFAADTVDKIYTQRYADALVAMNLADKASFADLSAKMTRGGFAVLIGKLLNIAPLSGGSGFADVDYSGDMGKYIYATTKQGIFSGTGNSMFSPLSAVTAEQAIRVLVSSLGYGDVAKARGGDYGAYYRIAKQIDFLDGDDSFDGEMTCGDTAELIYKAMTCSIYTVSEFTDSGFKLSSGDSLLYVYHGIKYFDGILTDSGFASLTGDSDVGEGCIAVGGKKIKTGGYSPLYGEYLGLSVECFASESGSSQSDLLCIFPKEEDNRIITVESDDIEEIKSTYVKYFDEKDKERRLSLSSDMDVVFNQKGYSKYTIDNLNPKDGKITLIDNNADGSYDVLKVEKNEIITVLNADRYSNKIYDKYTRDITELSLSAGVDSFKIYYDGLEKEIGDIGEYDVLSVQKSGDGKNYTIFGSKKAVSGVIKAKDDEKIYISGNGYEYTEYFEDLVSKGFIQKPEVGTSCTLYLDINGRIAAVSSVNQSEVYGFAEDVNLTTGLSSAVSLKIFNETGNFENFKLAEKIRFNGVRTDSVEAITSDKFKDSKGNFIRQLIKYKLNSDGEITSLKTAKDMSASSDYKGYDENNFTLDGKVEHGSRYYEGALRRFEGSRYYLYSDSMKVFIVPTVSGRADKYFQIADKKYFNSGVKDLALDIYDADETFAAGCAVVYKDRGYEDALDFDATFMCISNISYANDDDGNTRVCVSGYNRDYDLKKYLKDDDLTSEFSPYHSNYAGIKLADLPVGSIIRFSSNARDEILAYYPVYIPGKEATDKSGNEMKNWIVECHESSGFKYNENPNWGQRISAMADVKRTYDGRMVLNASAEQEEKDDIMIGIYNSHRIILADRDKKNVELGTLKDVGIGDKLFFHIRFGSLGIVVVYKN